MSDAMLAALRSSQPQPVLLCEIILTVPSGRTIRISDKEVDTPDGNTWEEFIVSADPIRAPGGFLATGPSPVSTSIRLCNKPFAWQNGLGNAIAALSAYQFEGARVILFIWERGLAAIAEPPAQIFDGEVMRVSGLSQDGFTLELVEDQGWNARIPARSVDRIAYPESPDVAQGVPIPVAVGDFGALPMRAPWAAAFTKKKDQEDSGGGLGVVPFILVDRGTGAAKVTVVAASHQCAEILDRTAGYSAFVRGNQLLSPLDTPGLTKHLGAGLADSYLTIDDDTLYAFGAVIPIDVRLGGGNNTADNPRRAMDTADETSFATLDQGAGKGVLDLVLPGPASLGYPDTVDVILAFIGNAGNTHNIRVYPYNPTTTTSGASVNTASTPATPQILRGSWDGAWWTRDWSFAGFNSPVGKETIDLRVDFAGGTTNKASVLWVAIVPRYRPERSVVIPSSVVNWTPVRFLTTPWIFRDDRTLMQVLSGAPRQTPGTPTVYELDGAFYGNIKGPTDDGGGTYTGTASALIQRAPDIARWLMSQYGGLTPATDFEVGAATFGSFALARSLLKGGAADDFTMAVHIGQKTTLDKVIGEIANQSLSLVYKDRFTSKWMFHPWQLGSQRDYWRPLEYDDAQLEYDSGSDVDVRQAIRIAYAYDYFKNRALFESFVTPDGSTQGFTYPTTRDQQLVVTAGVNDKLDWKTGATFADTLDPATYTGIDLAANIRSKMRAHVAAAHVGYGFSIKAGYNDKLDFQVGGAGPIFTATLNPGDYSLQDICSEVVRAMSATAAGAGPYGCLYDDVAANCFRITATVGINILPRTGPNQLTSGLYALGLTTDTAVVTSVQAVIPRYMDCFWFDSGSATTMQILWASGANAATNCALLTGSDKVNTAVDTDQRGKYARGDRERAAAASQVSHGPREELPIAAQWIRKEAVAVQLRNRLFDLRSQPRPPIRLTSTKLWDLQRMRVLELSSDFDSRVAFPGYASDGSWANKRFRVLEVTQHIVSSWHQEVIAVAA